MLSISNACGTPVVIDVDAVLALLEFLIISSKLEKV